jgi:AhpD family alkylhydroperoxidase
MGDYYTAEGGKNLKKLRDASPDLFQELNKVNEQVFAPGALSTKDKELIAVGAAHTTCCPWCIDVHVKKAKKAGAGIEEVAEAIFVGIALAGGAAFAHSSIDMQSLEEGGVKGAHHYPTEGVRGKYMKLGALKPDAAKAFGSFDKKVFSDGALPAKTKELIAVAATKITQCPYCIDAHTQRAAKAGATEEEIAEAVFVGIGLAAGRSYAHAAIGMAAYDD